LYPHPVLPVTSVTESVRQTLGFAVIFEATLIGLLPAQRPRRNRRTTSRQGKLVFLTFIFHKVGAQCRKKIGQ